MDAFNHVIDRHQGALLRLAQAILSDVHAAQDAVDEGFMRLAREAETVGAATGAKESLGGWLCTVVRNCAIDTLRRSRPHVAIASDPESGRPTPAAEAADHDQRSLVWQQVDGLPPLERAAVILRYRDDLSYQDIASRLGKSVSHIGVILQQAFTRLRASRSLRAEVLS